MSNQDKDQSKGRTENAAQPKAPGTSEVTPQAYPATRPDDSVGPAGAAVTDEGRSFDPPSNPAPRQGAGDGSVPAATNDGRMGPGGDPAEGKR